MTSFKVIISLLIVLITNLTFGQTELEDKEKKLYKKARVTTETVMGYGIDSLGKPLDIGTKKSTRTFDKNGNAIAIIEYNKESQPIKRKVFKYSKGRLVGGIVYKGFDQTIDKYKLKYDANGNKTLKKGFLESNPYQIVYTYDSKNRLLTKTKTANDKQIYKYAYTYGVSGVTEEKYWSEKLNLTKTFEYNEAGLLVKEKSRTDQFQGYTYDYEYNDKGQRTKETKYTIENLPYEWFIYTYDGENLKSIEKYDFRGNSSYKWSYAYNGKGNIDYIKIMESEEYIYQTKYLYKYLPKPKKK